MELLLALVPGFVSGSLAKTVPKAVVYTTGTTFVLGGAAMTVFSGTDWGFLVALIPTYFVVCGTVVGGVVGHASRRLICFTMFNHANKLTPASTIKHPIRSKPSFLKYKRTN